ncbi:MAG: TonB-dependent receptor [Opitutae bacterium]|nr:TonB-dependent receptor [Opitutae bacterium]
MYLMKYACLSSLLTILTFSALFAQQDEAEEIFDEEALGEIVELGEFVVVGSRHEERALLESSLPVDLIGGGELAPQGYRDMDDLLSNILPSFNINPQPISDAATLVRPASLRGLPSDATLILINGKRRHRASVISFLGGGTADGAQGPDITAIPAIALDRVEVLRDGASAQYGSDAIAGVLNFVLKDDAYGGRYETSWGEHYEGDGLSQSIAANWGVPLTEKGFANISFEYIKAGPTVRSAQRADAQGLIDANQPHISPYIRQPYAQIWGSPEVHSDFKSFVNLGAEISDDAEFYSFGSFAKRKVDGGFYFRNPTNRGGVFLGPRRFKETTSQEYWQNRVYSKNDFLVDHYPDFNSLSVSEQDRIDKELGPVFTDLTYPTIKVAVLDPALVGDYEAGMFPDRIVTLNPDGTPNEDALQAVAGDPNLFAFNEKLPGGFTPQFGGYINDMSWASGVRGELENWWRYDLSAVIGRHETQFYMHRTINPQTIVHPDFRNDPASIPTTYRPGDYIETDYTINLDISRLFEVDFLDDPLSFSAGLEYRVEEFEIVAGEEYAWYVDGREGGIAAQGFGVGSNGFPAFPPSIAGTESRASYAAYLDLEAEISEDALLSGAIRYENYENFDAIIGGKVSYRYEVSDDIALRGSANTGFRVPSIGQASVRNVTTEFGALPDGGFGLRDRALTPASELPASLGAVPLKEETSTNFSLGAVFEYGEYHFTVDYYNIKVKDRIAVTDAVNWPTDAPNPNNYSAVTWFANDFDTTSQGLDIVGDYDIEWEGGSTVLTLAVNLSDTSVDEAGDFITAKRIEQLEKTIPKNRLILSAESIMGPWRFMLPRIRYYGEFVEYTSNTDAWRQEYGAKTLVDVEAEYSFNNGVYIAAGVKNLFDTYPDENNPLAIAGVGAPYPEVAPFGFNGGYYYVRAVYDF